MNSKKSSKVSKKEFLQRKEVLLEEGKVLSRDRNKLDVGNFSNKEDWIAAVRVANRAGEAHREKIKELGRSYP
jgi:hypothetical protein